jgi:radical SAM protein with 4Fe4S-binding SPASM domain
MSVDTDGSVYPCPVAFEQPTKRPYGNLVRESLEGIWNNEWYARTRDYLTTGVKSTGDDQPRLPCYECRFYGDREERGVPARATN